MTDKQDPKTQGAPFRVSLEVPLKTPNGEVKTITFRRGQVKDMMAAQRIEPNDNAQRELVLMSMLAEEKLTPEDLQELDLADMAEVQAAFQLLFVRRTRA
jgi:hypothetical protein